MNPDSVQMVSMLSAEGAEVTLGGAHALAAHGLPRATADLDISIRPTPANGERVNAALARVGTPLDQIAVEDLAREGSFDDAWPRRIQRAARAPKDLADIAHLEVHAEPLR